MRSPSPRGTPIDDNRIREWVDRFVGYRRSVTVERVQAYLDQFKNVDLDIAARVLDVVEFFNPENVEDKYRACEQKLPNWDPHNRAAPARWRFAAYSRSAGESGSSMLHSFRTAVNLSASKFNSYFIEKRDLTKARLTSSDSVVFVDDFAGSGDQVVREWPLMRELMSGDPNAYLLLVAATQRAKKRIREETDLQVIVGRTFGDSDDFFSPACIRFELRDKNRLEKYCKIADSKNPRGYKECGLLCVFCHKAPNNSLPILHANKNRKWKGLFPRVGR